MTKSQIYIYIYKYKKTIKLKKQVGMVMQKSAQTRVVGKITDKVHPYILFSSNMVSMKIEVRDAPCLLFSLLLLFVYFFAPPSLLASSI